jgi:hypothetical protein
MIYLFCFFFFSALAFFRGRGRWRRRLVLLREVNSIVEDEDLVVVREDGGLVGDKVVFKVVGHDKVST